MSLEVDKGRTRTHRHTVRFTDEEELLLQKRMRAATTTNAYGEIIKIKPFEDYARQMLLTGKVWSLNFKEFFKLTNELGRLGNNVNQIAIKVNETDQVSRDDIASLRKELSDVSLAVQKYTESKMAPYYKDIDHRP